MLRTVQEAKLHELCWLCRFPELVKSWPGVSFDVKIGVMVMMVLAWLVVLCRTFWYHDITRQRDKVYEEGELRQAKGTRRGESCCRSLQDSLFLPHQ